MQWSKHKVQGISCIENTKLESRGEGNASTFHGPSPISSLLARFSRVSSHVIFAADYAGLPAVADLTLNISFLQGNEVPAAGLIKRNLADIFRPLLQSHKVVVQK
jgi:hypothetical protein